MHLNPGSARFNFVKFLSKMKRFTQYMDNGQSNNQKGLNIGCNGFQNVVCSLLLT